MSSDLFGPEVLTTADVEAAFAELARARDRPYYDVDADRAASEEYYSDVEPGQLRELVTRSHRRTPVYKPAREVYPWVDLQPSGLIRSLYTGQEWDPEDLIRSDVEVAAARAREVQARLSGPSVRSPVEVQAEVEAALPFNCEHVVPQSWFAKKEPMRGDLHHLFACESRCNSFRGNTPFAEFDDFPQPPAPGPGPGPGLGPGVSVVRGDCGKSEQNGFEPAHGKGPAARAVFYFLLRYPGQVQEAEMPASRLDMVLAWHEQDPVSEWERHRNAAIFERQGNRNPFIDHPDAATTFLGSIDGLR